jgi:hypothetical protein
MVLLNNLLFSLNLKSEIMSELDYQRGLRGGSCLDYDGQSYSDWSAGNQEYERQRKETEFREELEADKYYSPEEQTERYKKREAERNRESERIDSYYAQLRKSSKEAAFKRADENISIGSNLGLFSFVFFSILIGGYIIKWILGWFNFHLSSIVIWAIAIFVIILMIFESYKHYKKETKEAEMEYGKRE